jgi:hypothetical protein
MMCKWPASLKKLSEQQGVTAIFVGLWIIVFIGVGALAIDLSHLFVVRNELQNAADAAALAGARFLYNSDGMAINAGANQIACDTATENRSEEVPVDVRWSEGNTGDVQRGHWSFATRTFAPNDSLLPVPLWDFSFEELDQNPNFVNAVRVRTRREDTPAASFLAKVFGIENFTLSGEAIGYIGFAGSLNPFDVDQPIAICKESILSNDRLTCTVGRMINSGQIVARQETSGWTDFSQDSACLGGTNASAVNSLVCSDGNPQPIIFGESVATNGGDIASAFAKFSQCWANKTGKTQPWKLTLLVIDCPGNNVGTCQNTAGAVTVDVIWVTGQGDDPQYNDAPTQMGDWLNNNPNGQVRWDSFVQYFNLRNLDNSPARYAKKSIYFLPDCKPHYPTGRTGGKNFGILAKIPVLVK